MEIWIDRPTDKKTSVLEFERENCRSLKPVLAYAKKHGVHSCFVLETSLGGLCAVGFQDGGGAMIRFPSHAAALEFARKPKWKLNRELVCGSGRLFYPFPDC